jgi:hypothetical protein
VRARTAPPVRLMRTTRMLASNVDEGVDMNDEPGRFARLPEPPRAEDLVVEVPAFEDDREDPPPVPPAAAPELVAATQIAQASHRVTIRRTQIPTGLVLVGVPVAIMAVIAAVQILFFAD